jgi:adenine-specific DNA-methyltransferase
MATGITDKSASKRRVKSYRIEYDGKQDVDSILSGTGCIFDRIIEGKEDNSFYYGDNINVLHHLIDSGMSGKVRLVYIDPPYATKSAFVGRNQKYAYSDSLAGADYIEFLRERIILIRELLADNGSMYLHLDGNMAFPMKLIMDEIFGGANCRAFITRKKCSTKNYTKNTFGNVCDYVMFYSKTGDYVWNRPYDPWDEDKMLREYPYVTEDGRRYKKVPIHAPGVRHGATGGKWKGMMPPEGKHWQYTPEKLTQLDEAGDIYWSPNGNPRRKVYCDAEKGVPIQDLWLNYRDSINQQMKTTGYPTEKNIDMLRMIVQASSESGDYVMDCFAGGGTTLGAAQELGRRWIGADNSPESLSAVIRRFRDGLQDYGDYVSKPFDQPELTLKTETDGTRFSLFSEHAKTDEALSIIKSVG